MHRPLFALAALALVSGCIPAMTTYDRPQPNAGVQTGPALPPMAALPPAEYVQVTLADGSPGLGLWCDVQSDCIEAARILCDNRQSIRASADIDRAMPGSTEFFVRSTGAPHNLTVSCPSRV
ncbi:hypothetical protein HKCCE2091_20650 [Rhodobacterales bacterium HKCCE2091]|nr:hypothetical protein [Rhodobacterales bacterium HKCCE2091]